MSNLHSTRSGRTLRALALLLPASAAIACASPGPSPELVAARTAYGEAKKGPAAELAPARLEEARQALEAAEAAFEDDAKGEEAKTAAYIAIRRAELATIRGSEKEQMAKLEELKAQYAELEKKNYSKTQAELEAAQAQLKKERDKREAAEGRLAAAVASLKEMAQVKEEARGMVITLSGSVLFATGKYQLLPIAKEKLNDVSKALIDQGYKKIIVEGHTDSQGSESNNEALSLKRAESVREHMVSQGIEPDKIQAKGLGESRPVADNSTPEGRANNRRVEIIVE